MYPLGLFRIAGAHGGHRAAKGRGHAGRQAAKKIARNDTLTHPG
jgi:hypothetical protein